MIKCNKCGRENEDHYKFCLGCGASLDDQKKASAASWPSHCPSCGAAVQPNQRFCGGCGFNMADHVAALAAQKPAPAPPPPSPPKPAPATAATATSGGPTAAGGQAPAPMPSSDGAPAFIVFVKPDGTPGDAYPLQMGENPIGRNSVFGVFNSDAFLNMNHASIRLEPQGAMLQDRDSLNGVFIRISAPIELKHGDEIRIGQERLRFEVLDQMPPLDSEPTDGTTLLGSPRGGAWARLCRLSAYNEASIVFVLRQDEHRLGREQGDILFPDDGYVSGRHARIYRENGRYMLEDLRSSNGSFIRLREPTSLPPNSLILLGEKPYRFVRPA